MYEDTGFEPTDEFKVGPQPNDPPARSLRIALIGLAFKEIRKLGESQDMATGKIMKRWYGQDLWREKTLDQEWCLAMIEHARQNPRAKKAQIAMTQWQHTLEKDTHKAIKAHEEIEKTFAGIGGWAWEIALQATPPDPELYIDLEPTYGLIATYAYTLGENRCANTMGVLANEMFEEGGVLDRDHWRKIVERAKATVPKTIEGAMTLRWIESVERDLRWSESVESDVSPMESALMPVLRNIEDIVWRARRQPRPTNDKRALCRAKQWGDSIAARVLDLGDIKVSGEWKIARMLGPIECALAKTRAQLEAQLDERERATQTENKEDTPIENAQAEKTADAIDACIKAAGTDHPATNPGKLDGFHATARSWTAHVTHGHLKGEDHIRERLLNLAKAAKEAGARKRNTQRLIKMAKLRGVKLIETCNAARMAAHPLGDSARERKT